MQLLQHMFDRFDTLADVFQVQKVGVRVATLTSYDPTPDVFQVQKVRKTANESYLAAAGLPDPALLPSETDRACGIAGFGFALINIMEVVNLEIRNLGLPEGLNLSVQVGIDSGFAIAGVIGHKTFQYDLCGDAVNTAARMCSYSEPGRVNVSERTHALVSHRFSSEEQAEREIKGKGRMKTYFLNNAPPPATPGPPSYHANPALQLSGKAVIAAVSAAPTPSATPAPSAVPTASLTCETRGRAEEFQREAEKLQHEEACTC